MTKRPSWFRMQRFYLRNWLNRTWRRKVKPALKRPICLVLGHKLYKDCGWACGYWRCERHCSYSKLIYRSKTLTHS